MRISLSILALVSLSTVSSANPQFTEANMRPLPPAKEWRAEGAKIVLSDPEPGVLTVDYDFKLADTFTVGHLTFHQATSRVLLEHPIHMGREDMRILFEARGIERLRNRSGKRQILPLVRDQQGEIFVCEPFSYPHLKTGGTDWALWMTSYLQSGEAGGPTQNVYQTDGKGDGWPEPPLEFIGFEVQVRGEKNEEVKGQFALSGFAFAGLKVPLLPPFFYADALLNQEKGDFIFEAEAATIFQGRPGYTNQHKFSYDGGSLLSRKQRLTLPTGPENDFWTSYRLVNDEGKILAAESLTYRVDPGGENPATRTSKSQSRPLQISTEGPLPGVIPKDQKWGVHVAVGDLKTRAKITLRWRLLPANYPEVLASGEIDFPETPTSRWLELPKFPPRDAYRLEAVLMVGETKVDEVTYYLGSLTDFSAAYAGRKGTPRLRDEVKSTAYFRTTFRPTAKLKSEDAVMDEFRAHLREATQMARDTTIMVDAADLEVLPGVFDFSLLDRMMDAAADYGSGVTIRLAHTDAHASYLWPKLERQRNFDGSEIHHHHYGNYSPHDPEHVALWKRANRAFYDRYKTHPAFQGYYIMQPAGEAVVLDQPWLANIAGYSHYARLDFQKYLKENLSLSLEDINKRWGASYRDWSEVDVPQPDFSLRTKPDLRSQWLDFQQFKAYTDRVGWFLELAKDIRKYDQDRTIIVYSWDLEPLKNLVDYSHGGGVPESPGHGETEKYWLENRIGGIQESIHPHRWGESGDPGDLGWLLDWNLYTMFSLSGGGGTNIHIYYYPIEGIVKKFGGNYAFDRYQKFKPILSELHGARLLTPLKKQVAVIQDPLTLQAKHRTTFGHRMTDLRRWFEVILHSGIEYEALRPGELKNYKLLLPNLLEEVMPRKTIQTLSEFVHAGGKTIIAANTGRYDDVMGSPPFPLLQSLGIDPPQGAYITSGRDISAEFVPGASPLTASLKRLELYTVEKQKQEARLPWKFEEFKQWPYKWLPETDYFGYYPGQHPKNAVVLAKFADGGAALSLHRVGKGEVLVFWGTPDYRDSALVTLLKNSLAWAGVSDESAFNPIPLMMEATNEKIRRHYGILWHDKPGSYTQRFPFAPDGELLVEDLVSEERLGIFDGKTLREKGLQLNFTFGYSPLKVLRFRHDIPDWARRYYQSAQESKSIR